MNLVYDLSKAPASWDFLQWLINAEIVRADAGSEQLGVCFRDGPKDGFRDDALPRPLDQRQAIFENVMKPGVTLVGGKLVEEGEDSSIPYVTRFAVDHAVKNGGDIPYFRVPIAIVHEVLEDYKDRRPVIITLRESNYLTERNSNLEAWKEFARICGEDVIFVRDTVKADEPLDGFETCPRASKELWYRAALMRIAKCNMMVANGPWVLNLYSPCPWLNFGALRPELPTWKPGQPEWWTQQMGVQPGNQFPWSHINQRMIWEHDTLKSIQKAWDEHKPVMDSPPPYKLGDIPTKGVWSDEERLENCLVNMKLVRDRVPELPAHNGVAIIACYGPSLKDTLTDIRHQRNNIPGATLVSVSGAHDFLVSQRLKPNFHVECDPRPHKAEMLKRPSGKTRYLLASCVHPDMMKRLKGYKITLWHLLSGSASMKIIEYEKDALLTTGGGSVGLRAITLMYQLGYRTFYIHGMDCSFRNGEQHAGKHLGKIQKQMRVQCGDMWFNTSSIQVAYARQFLDMFDKMNHGADFRGHVRFAFHGDGLLRQMCKVGIEEMKQEKAA